MDAGFAPAGAQLGPVGIGAIVGLILAVLGDGNDGKRAKRHVAAAMDRRG
jgi:hypothetical protein